MLALKNGLTGHVLNTEQGVIIEVEGAEGHIEAFIEYLKSNPPPLAKIISIKASDIPVSYEASFSIRQSLDGSEPDVSIPPDLAICPECLEELKDPSDRRYHYPFINCTQCGPRLSIIKKVPYDRRNTSISFTRSE